MSFGKVVALVACFLALIACFTVGCTTTEGVCKRDLAMSDAETNDAAPTCGFVGTWASSKNTITFAADGTYTATLNGTADHGTWSISGVLDCGATLTLGDAMCGTVFGTYGVSIDATCTTFSLSGQSDDCGTRANELSDTEYKKQ